MDDRDRSGAPSGFVVKATPGARNCPGWACGLVRIPPIGLVYFTHTYGSDVDGITRSAAAEWHYKHGYYDFGFIGEIFFGGPIVVVE